MGARRFVSIDVARGFAILWVLGYHLWTDLRFPDVYPRQGDALREVYRQLADVDVAGALGAVCEAFLRLGHLGVPLFMMLSGLSLTLSALRREASGDEGSAGRPRRLRRLLVPYWTGFAITVAFAAALAFVQWQRHGGAPYIDYFRDGDIDMDNEQLIAGALLIPRMWRDEWQFAPEGSLWFVVVLGQYYLLFPVLFAGMKRYGAVATVCATAAITIGSGAVAVALWGDLAEQRSWVEMLFPFRVVEFGAGMAIGYLLAPDGGLEWSLSSWPFAAGGIVFFIAGCLIELDAGYLSALRWPLIVAGLALMAIPLLDRIDDVASPALALQWCAWIGVMSYAVLIVSEPLRSITHTMRAEAAGAWWLALWVAAGFIPLSILLARPLAAVLGLLPKENRAQRVDIPSPQARVLVAADQVRGP